MNRNYLLAGAAALALLATSGLVEAAPYAGVVRVASTTIGEGAGTTISYQLPYAADTVTIDILDSSNATVATFAGTADAGSNTVVWDGTADNAGGTPLPIDTGYTVQITVDANPAAGWTLVAENGSGAGPATLPSGFSPVGVHLTRDESSDYFGYIFARTSWSGSTPPHSGTAVLDPDLTVASVYDGTLTGLVNQSPDQVAGATFNGSQWGGAIIPGSEAVIYGTQGTVEWFVAANPLVTSTTDIDAIQTIGDVASNPRDVEVVEEGGQLYAYAALGSGTVIKQPIDSTGTPTALGFNILTNNTNYSKDVEFDADGNLYWSSRDGFLWRFDAADIQAITADTDPKLDPAVDAAWTIDFSTATNARLMGSTVTPDGDVYSAAVDAGTETDSSIYFIGNASTATLTLGVTDSDEVFGDGTNLDGIYGNIDSDAGGNLIIHNRGPEIIRMWAEGGASTQVTSAPASQAFDIANLASASHWTVYE